MTFFKSFIITTALAAGTIPTYAPVSGIAGNIKAIGSDSMNNEMALWGESFRKQYPAVKIEIEGKGSATAPPALTEGTAQLGPMSRPMKNEEIQKFEKKFGYPPTAMNTSLDVLAVYVHRDNPLKEVSMEKLDAIFSKTRKGGEKEIRTWGDLGLTGTWKDKPIQMYGRNSASGTYGYFKEHALFKGDFKDQVKEMPGSSAVVQAVSQDRFSIGYSGIGYIGPGVKALALSTKGNKAVIPSSETAYNQTYPLARYLIIYTNISPTNSLEPVQREFLRFILSKQGQDIAARQGYIPLTSDLIQKELAKIQPPKK